MSGKHPFVGPCRNSNGDYCMSKALKDYAVRMWLDPGNKEDLSCMSLSICHGWGMGSVDANLLISDGSDKVYIDCSTYKKKSHKKKIDLMIKALEEFKERLEEFEAAQVDRSSEVDAKWLQ